MALGVLAPMLSLVELDLWLKFLLAFETMSYTRFLQLFLVSCLLTLQTFSFVEIEVPIISKSRGCIPLYNVDQLVAIFKEKRLVDASIFVSPLTSQTWSNGGRPWHWTTMLPDWVHGRYWFALVRGLNGSDGEVFSMFQLHDNVK